MAKYWRLAREYRISYRSDGIGVREVYLRDDTNGTSASLPAIGDAALDESGSTIASCLAREKIITYQDGDTNSQRIEFVFDTDTAKYSGGIQKDQNISKYSCGIKATSIQQPSGATYAGGGAANEPLSKKEVIGSFTVPKVVTDFSAWITLAKTHAGNINTSEFRGFPIGCVAFDGWSGQTEYAANGSLRYALELQFSWRFIQGVSGNTWQCSLTTAGEWEIVIFPDGSFTFGSSDLNLLL